MPVDYSTWLGRMAGTIPDNSIVDKWKDGEFTQIQKRMMIADMLVPFAGNRKNVENWLKVFCIDVDENIYGEINFNRASLKQLVGTAQEELYAELSTDREYYLWLVDLKTLIKAGTIK